MPSGAKTLRLETGRSADVPAGAVTLLEKLQSLIRRCLLGGVVSAVQVESSVISP